MTLTVDAARAAFNSSTTTVSVKRDIARFWPSFCDWEPHICIVLFIMCNPYEIIVLL